MLLFDVDVGDGGLAIDFLQGSLDGGSIIYLSSAFCTISWHYGLHTNLIKLDSVVVCTKLGQESLGSLAVWAIRLAEDGYTGAPLAPLHVPRAEEGAKHTNSILINDLLGLGLCCRHGCGVDSSCLKESA